MLTTTYLVRTPIHGYSGMGYESIPYLEYEFKDEQKARKWKKHCDFAYKIQHQHYHFGCEDRYDDYIRKMTDEISYSFRGESKIYKKQVVCDAI
jgi:hypothetical protein